MIIYGKDERAAFEEKHFSKYVKDKYNNAKTFHDGKWIMFEAPSDELDKNLLNMLLIKRKPDKN